MGAALATGKFKAVLPSEAPSNKRAAKKPQKYSREELKLMRTHLPSFVFVEKSTEAHRAIAGAHWDRVIQATASKNSKTSNTSQREPKSAVGTAATSQRESKAGAAAATSQKSKLLVLYDEFFAYLEEHSPELRPVFRSSMQVRSKVLVHISIGMRTLMSSDKFVDKVLPLTKTHRRFGVKLEHYEPLGRALMHAMEFVSGPEEWTPEVEDAWKRLFSHTSVLLMRAQKRVDDRIAKEAAKPVAPRRMMTRQPYRGKKPKKNIVMPTVADLVPHIFGRRGVSIRESLQQGPSIRALSIGGYDTEARSRHVPAAASSIAE